MLTVESVVRGYHVYKDDWSPSVGGAVLGYGVETIFEDFRGRPTGRFFDPSSIGLNLRKTLF